MKASEILLEKDLQHFNKFLKRAEVQDEIIKKYIKNGMDECCKIAQQTWGLIHNRWRLGWKIYERPWSPATAESTKLVNQPQAWMIKALLRLKRYWWSDFSFSPASLDFIISAVLWNYINIKKYSWMLFNQLRCDIFSCCTGINVDMVRYTFLSFQESGFWIENKFCTFKLKAKTLLVWKCLKNSAETFVEQDSMRQISRFYPFFNQN